MYASALCISGGVVVERARFVAWTRDCVWHRTWGVVVAVGAFECSLECRTCVQHLEVSGRRRY